jgi:polyisoprenoid-binding protein YceI
MRPFSPLPCVIALLLAPTLVLGAPRTVRLAPSTAALAIRAYAMGLVPIDARFARFDGTLTYDPDGGGRCSARLVAQVDSMQASDPATRETMLGADFLDAARFPTLTFVGACTGPKTVEGQLTMRGVTRPLGTSLAWSPHGLATEADIRRAQWGMDARPFAVGPVIRMRLTAALP